MLCLSLVIALYVLQSCNESTILGGSIAHGNGDTPAMETDTFTVRTRTIFRNQDSAYGTTTTNVTAGTINSDPTFGKTVGMVYLQLGLPSASASFSGPAPVLDSVVLSLRYAGYYGDSMGAQTYTIYRIVDTAFSDTSLKYYIHQQFDIDRSTPLGTATVTPKGLGDSVSIYGVKEPAQLRIKLNQAFGNTLLHQDSDGALANDSAFHRWLKGLALVPDSTTAGRNSLMYFELNNTYTGMTVFYKNSTTDSLTVYFPFKAQTGVWSNYIQHNFEGSKVAVHLQDSANVSDSVIFLQDQSGLYADIHFPYLQDFPPALINKAELILTQVDDPGNATFQSPYELFLWQYENAEKDSLGYVVDAGVSFSSIYGTQFTNMNYFGGLAKMITNKEGKKVVQYRFNITRYLQHLLTPTASDKETNYGFRLGIMDPLERGRDVGRVVLGGGNHSTYSMKLHVVFTNIQ